MKTIFPLLLLLTCLNARAAFTEFYYNSTGTNVNAGSTTNATPLFSATAGDWVAATGVYTKAGSDLSAVSAGMWASVYVDGATTAQFIGRITAVNDGADTITVSTTIKTGTAPADGTATRSIRVGGAWYGPWFSGATVDTFPFGLVNNLLTNTSLHMTRVNVQNFDFTRCTNVVVFSNGPIRFQGYATNAGDGARVGVNYASYIATSSSGIGTSTLSVSGVNIDLVDLFFFGGGASGNPIGVLINAAECSVSRCLFKDMRGIGLQMSVGGLVEECEAVNCNSANTSVQPAFLFTAQGVIARRCIAHDNVGATTSGFQISQSATMQDCIAAGNGRDGLTINATTAASVYGCDFYGNGTNGINMTGSGAVQINIENCTFIKNGAGLTGAYAINSSGGSLRNGNVLNCAFGTGTTGTNGSGGANIFAGTTLEETGSIGFASNVTPWVDPVNGNFSKTNTVTTVLGVGRGSFFQAGSSTYTGTASYPDIGATQITNSPGGVMAYPLSRR